MDTKLFVNNIIALRKFITISQPQLANALNRSTATVSKWERHLLKTMPDNKATEIFEKIKKISNFPKAIKLEMFLKSDLNEIFRHFTKGRSGVYDEFMAEISHEEQKTHGLYPGLYYLLDDDKMRTLHRINDDEIEELKEIRFVEDEPPIWATKEFYIETLYHVRLAKRKMEKKNRTESENSDDSVFS